jgi:hypothetical protein
MASPCVYAENSILVLFAFSLLPPCGGPGETFGMFEHARTHGVRLYTDERGVTAIRLRMRDPDDAPNPVCVLTNAAELAFS